MQFKENKGISAKESKKINQGEKIDSNDEMITSLFNILIYISLPFFHLHNLDLCDLIIKKFYILALSISGEI